MVLGGRKSGAAKVTAALFNTQSGQSCYIKNLLDSSFDAGGGIFDGFPAYCGGQSYYEGQLDTCYKFYNNSWIPVRNHSYLLFL